MTMTSNCDATNSVHQIQMATDHMPLNENPHENFLRTPLLLICTTSVVENLQEGPPIENSLGPRK